VNVVGKVQEISSFPGMAAGIRFGLCGGSPERRRPTSQALPARQARWPEPGCGVHRGERHFFEIVREWARMELPTKIGRYEIQRKLGQGMMGIVYQARDTVLQRNVALKTISLAFTVTEKEREAFEARFLQEARAAATLAHPGIVVVYDVGTDLEAGTLYMALEFLRGKTLESILAAGQVLDWREAIRTVARVAEALHHAHAHGIIHRDVKPANIMILASGEPKVLDFGVAKLEGAELTVGGKVLGSPSYMSPEQMDGAALDARSDLFSLGAVLYELVTGQKAFGGPDLPTIVKKLAYEDPPPPSSVRSRLPTALDGVVARALAKDPARRYPNGKVLAEDIEDLLADRAPRHLPSSAPSQEQKTLVPQSGPLAIPPARPIPGASTVTGGAAGGSGLSLPLGKRVSLAFLTGERRGEVFLLARPRALIGRNGGRASADIELSDPEVSRTHALVECHGSRVVIRDLGSTNGTFVGESRIEEQTLEDKSEFRIGGTRIMLIVSDAD
jgi:serine/threonine protein kinase